MAPFEPRLWRRSELLFLDHQDICHPERSGSRGLRDAESKDPEGGGSGEGVCSSWARAFEAVVEKVWAVLRV
jgi:hypothetical protein